MGDVTEMLEADHREAEDLFAKIKKHQRRCESWTCHESWPTR